MGKIGEGHGEAFLRQGLRELRGAMYPESNVAQQPEYGLYGTRTPGEIAEDRRGDTLNLEEEQPVARESVLKDRMRQAGTREPPEERGLDRE